MKQQSRKPSPVIDRPAVSHRVPIGIDPGLGETGVVILDPQDSVIACATWTAARGNDLERCISLAGTVAAWVFRNVPPGKTQVEIGLETPVLTGSAVVFAKQWRFISLLEYFLWLEARKLNRPVALIEVTPSESKKALTGYGAADKEDMIGYSSFTDSPVKQHTKETLADSEAHAQAAKKGFGGLPVALDMVVPIRLKAIHEQKREG